MADSSVELDAGTGGAQIDTRTATGGDHRQVVVLGEGAATSDALIPGDGTDGLLVNLGTNNDVTVSGVATAANQLPDGHAVTVDNTVGSPANVQISDGTETALVNAAGELLVDEPNTVSTNNSSTATLGISGNFTGTGDDISDFSAITIQIDASHDSAASGMTFEFSTDNTNWDDVYTFTYTAADGARRFQFPATAQYFRVNYTNGGTGQTHFRLQTILHRHPVTTSIHRLGDNANPDRSSSVVKAAIMAQAGGSGDFIPVQASAGGNFKIDMEEVSGTAVSVNNGTVDAGTQRVTIASDSTGTVAATQSGTWNVTNVSGTVSLPTGAATAANQLPDGHNVTIDNAAGGAAVNIQDGGNDISIDWAGTAPPIGAGTEAAALRVTMATDSTGQMTVDGTVNAAQSGTWNVTNVSGTVSLPTGAATSANQLADGHGVTVDANVSTTGTTTFYDEDLDETKIAVDAGAVNIYSIAAFNTTAAPLFLQLFNIASASVTVGTTKPTNQYVIPGNADSDGAGFTLSFSVPKSYDTAFTIACTTDSEGLAAPGLGACIVNIEYAT